jgi:hypothetical protein
MANFIRIVEMFGLRSGDFSLLINKSVKFSVRGDDTTERQAVIGSIDTTSACTKEELGPSVFLRFARRIGPYVGLECYEDYILAVRDSSQDFGKDNREVMSIAVAK